MLLLSRSDVERLLDVDRLVDALGPAMAELSAGRLSMPARIVAQVRERRGLLGVMPVFLDSLGILSTKLVSVFPENEGAGLPSHQAVIVVFDAQTGSPRAMMDGTFITAARTAAGSALATRLLARPDAHVLAIVGTGVQARAHARAIPRVRTIHELRVVGRNPHKAAALAEQLASESRLRTTAWKLAGEAFAGADIICAATHSADPVIKGEWLRPGTHVNSVGLNPEGREVDGEAFRRARVVVETRAAALAPSPSGANDLLWAVRDGLLDEKHIDEIGEVFSGARAGRSSAQQISLYKSVGVAVQDAVAAGLVLEAAKRLGVGKQVDI